MENVIENLLVENFNNLDITIYGTHEEPLFKAKDIGELLGIEQIRKTIKNFDKDEAYFIPLKDALGRIQETSFLTEPGLYKMLMISRKPIAKQFQKWVFSVLKQIREKGSYDIKQKLIKHEQIIKKEKELIKEQTLIDSFDRKPVVYLGEVEKDLIKFGYTNDIKDRNKTHKREIGNCFIIQEIIECTNNKELETKLKEHNDIKNRRISKIINGKNQTELIRIDEYLKVKDISNILINIKRTLFIDKEILTMKHEEIIEQEKTKQLQTNKEIEQEKTKQLEKVKELEIEKEKTKQLELKLKLKIEENNNLNTKNNVQNIHKTTNLQNTKKQNEIEYYIRFINENTKISYDSNDRIKFIDLYKKFCLWVKTNNIGIAIPSRYEFVLRIKEVPEIYRKQWKICGKKYSGIVNRKLINF